jgi:putative endonuclease
MIGERIAADFLRLQGYTIIDRNYRYGHLEIDLIAARRGNLAFIEVKTRRSRRTGEAVEAVRRQKVANMRKAARGFLTRRCYPVPFDEMRFDLIAIDIDSALDTLVLRHIKGIV